jgi:hypothetical protein
VKETKFALSLARHGKVPLPFPPHVAKDVREARALRSLVKTQGRAGAKGIVQGEKGLAEAAHAREEELRLLKTVPAKTRDVRPGHDAAASR